MLNLGVYAVSNQTFPNFTSQYYQNVYDMTNYFHPNPTTVQDVIQASCGADGARDFVKVHSKASIKSIERLKVGEFESPASTDSLFMPLAVLLAAALLLIL